MKYKPKLTWCFLVLAVYAFSGGCVQDDFAEGSSLNSAQNHPQTQQATPQYPSQNLVDELHEHIVTRFNDLTLSSFGLGRVPLTYLHVAEYEASTNKGSVMGNSKSKEENEVVKAIKDLGIDMKIYVVGQGATKDDKTPWRVKGPIESNLLLESYVTPK